MKEICDSKFTLAPRGNVEDTWRLYEALHCGTIPVVTDGGAYFSQFLPKDVIDQFVTLPTTLSKDVQSPSYTHAFSEIEHLLADSVALDERQTKMRQAFQEYQESWKMEVWRRIQSLGEKKPVVENP